MASDYDACGPVPFEAPHRTKPGLEAPVVSLDPVVGILGGVVQCGRQEVRDHADQGVGPVSGDLSRLTVRADRIGEECCRSSQITLPGYEHIDDLPVLVNGPIDVPPGPGDLHVGLIDKPVTTHDVAARPSRHIVGGHWFVDETYVKVSGSWRYVYRAVDQYGQVIDVFVSRKRDLRAATAFFADAIRSHGEPAEITTDRA